MALTQNATDETSVLISPVELCPIEVWYHEIFPRIHSVDDRIAVYNTCTLFRDLLERKKHLWILPAVLPNFYKYLDKNSALTVRRVCKKWSNSLDEHLDSLYKDEFTFFNEDSKTFKNGSNYSVIDMTDRDPDRSRTSHLEDGCVLHDVPGVRALLQKVRNVENPMTSLPGGKLVATLWYRPFLHGGDDNADDMPEFVVEALSGLVAILEAVGQSLRYLKLLVCVTFTFNQERNHPVDGWLYRHVLQCLVAVPNVRFLKLAVEAEILYLNDNVTSDNQLFEMVEAMKSNPLPLTPRLQYFEPVYFNLNFGDERAPIVDHLYQHYTSAPIKWKWFGGNHTAHRNDPDYGPPRESLATLKELYYCDRDHGESIRGYPAPTLTTLRLRLQTFNLVWWRILQGIPENRRPVDVTALLESLNNLYPYLKNLSIECVDRRGLQQFSPLPDNIIFPRVTTLRLATCGVISYDVLRCFPSLERFSVVNDRITFGPQQRPLTEAQHEAVNWLDWERLEHSRAWSALPNLKIIFFKLVRVFFDLELEAAIMHETLETRECRRSRLIQPVQ